MSSRFAARFDRRFLPSFLLLFAVALSPLTAQRVPPDAHYRGFVPDGELQLLIDGKEQPKAEILFAETARAYVVISSELPSPLLVNAPAGTVETVDLMKVARQIDGSVDLLADATLAPVGKYEVREGEIAFTVGGKALLLKPRPWTLGRQTGAALLAGNPGYARAAKGYNPDLAIVKRLKSQKESVRVLTFFGSWCPHCKRNLPFLLKVEERLAGSRFQFEYYGLPRPFDADLEAKKHKIASVPTAVLIIGDKEVGRIPSSQWSNPEVALDMQLNGPGRSKER